jgi:negative regulator of flagellin synthesis FlgM
VTNKVGGFDSRPAQVGTDRGVKRASGATSAAPTGSPATTTESSVQITDSARQLAALEAAIKELPAVDEAKVAELRNAIENGSYEVDGASVADKLLKMDSELHDQGNNK